MENTLILLYFYSVRINLKKEKTQQDKLNELKEKSTLECNMWFLFQTQMNRQKRENITPPPSKKKLCNTLNDL